MAYGVRHTASTFYNIVYSSPGIGGRKNPSCTIYEMNIEVSAHFWEVDEKNLAKGRPGEAVVFFAALFSIWLDLNNLSKVT